jgi:hypothetical protein
MMRRLAEITLGLCLLTATGASAQYRPIGFQTPSKNIFCQFFALDGPATLRCDMMEINVRPRPPVPCEGDYGRAFEMTVKGPAERICRGDTLFDPSLPVLAYGDVWQRGGFTCRSEQTGLTCFNAMQHGFSLARAKQEVF